MIFDGKQHAADIATALACEVRVLGRTPSLGVCMVGEDEVSRRYVSIKKKIAENIGIKISVDYFPESATTEEIVGKVSQQSKTQDGYIVQLPLPPHIDSREVLNAVPEEKDVDMLSRASMDAYYKNETELLPPVVGAFAEILARSSVNIGGMRVAIVGYGALVGKPAEHWFKKQEAEVRVVRRNDDLKTATRGADIVILGAGSPGILTPDMVKEGVIVLDAGTSESHGTLKGDADPAVAQKACLFTPVPGGVGPLTVTALFKNVLALIAR